MALPPGTDTGGGHKQCCSGNVHEPQSCGDYPHAWAHRSCPATAGQAAASGLPPMHTYIPCRNRIPCRRAQSPTMIRAHCQDEATPKQRRVGSQDRAWPARPPREPETPQQPRVWGGESALQGQQQPFCHPITPTRALNAPWGPARHAKRPARHTHTAPPLAPAALQSGLLQGNAGRSGALQCQGPRTCREPRPRGGNKLHACR